MPAIRKIAAVAANQPSGFYDHDNAENPFKDWYHVIIPYCTGDIHWGDAVTTYNEGMSSEVTIIPGRWRNTHCKLRS